MITSVVELGNFVIVGALDAPSVIHVELVKLGQGLDTVAVRTKHWVALEQLAFGDPVHEVAKLKEDEVHIGEILAAKVSLLAQECDKRLDLEKQVRSDCHTVTLRVAWHRGGTLQVADNLGDHLDLADLRGAVAEQLWPELIRDVLHDRARVSQARLPVDKVGQVGESEANGVLLLEPA